MTPEIAMILRVTREERQLIEMRSEIEGKSYNDMLRTMIRVYCK